MIIINVWFVNFNSLFEVFEFVIVGIKQCVDFFLGFFCKFYIVFIFFVVSIFNWVVVCYIFEDGSEIIIGEDWDLDNSFLVKQGYGELKYVVVFILFNVFYVGYINLVVVF